MKVSHRIAVDLMANFGVLMAALWSQMTLL